jgi:sugar lactone lactonase YvrE
MRRTVPLGIGGALALAVVAAAVTPQKISVRTYDDFLRGKFDGVSVSADGVLTLSLREDRIEGPAEDFYLSFLMTPEGVAYLGTGHEGKVYRLGKDGKAELLFQAAEMDVTCLALDRKGALFAGTSPNGKIYKITAPGKGEEFFNPAERYIWELLFLENGNLLAAVGESGGIYEVSPQGEGRSLYKASENHILCLRLDRNGDIVAGSGGNGLVYRIAKSGGKGAVIFESPFEEVRSLAFDLDGYIYAAAGGTPTRPRDSLAVAPPAGREAEVSISISNVSLVPVTAGQVQAAPLSPQPKPAAAAAPGREPGAIFKLRPDGTAQRLWFSAEEMVYSLFWSESEKRLYFGTGPKGRLYALEREDKASLVVQKNSEQLLACVPVGTRIYLVGNNPAQLALLLPEQRLSGEYASPVWDARLAAAWGKIAWEATLPPGAALQFQTRTGNSAEPGPSWSDWSPPYQKMDGEQILSPKARFLQFRVLFKSPSGKSSPSLLRVAFHYLQTNVPPSVTRLELLGPNEVLLKPPDVEEAILGLERRLADPQAKKDELKFIAAKKVERKGYQSLQWDAEDENGDLLIYAISIKSDTEKEWRLLDDRWAETTYAFNTVQFPDGIYTLKVAASDGLSNPPGQEKTAERESGPLVIDNTAPALRNVQVAKLGPELAVSFQAEDSFSAIREARVLLRPGDWRIVFPEDGICDSKTERFAFKVPLPTGADNLLTITVRDAVGNVAVIRQIF